MQGTGLRHAYQALHAARGQPHHFLQLRAVATDRGTDDPVALYWADHLLRVTVRNMYCSAARADRNVHVVAVLAAANAEQDGESEVGSDGDGRVQPVSSSATVAAAPAVPGLAVAAQPNINPAADTGTDAQTDAAAAATPPLSSNQSPQAAAAARARRAHRTYLLSRCLHPAAHLLPRTTPHLTHMPDMGRARALLAACSTEGGTSTFPEFPEVAQMSELASSTLGCFSTWFADAVCMVNRHTVQAFEYQTQTGDAWCTQGSRTCTWPHTTAWPRGSPGAACCCEGWPLMTSIMRCDDGGCVSDCASRV